jgi:hypothetical protein
VVVLSAVAVGLILLLFASPLFAFSSKRTKSTSPAPLHAASVTARCPASEHVLFGGFQGQLRDSSLTPPIVIPIGMRITGSGNQVTVDGQDFTGSGTRRSRLTVTAYCYPGPAPTKATATKRVAHGSGSVTATCPAGKVVVAAGFASQAGASHGHNVNRVERMGTNRVRVALANPQGGSSSLTAIAYCGTGTIPTVVSKTISLAKGSAGTAKIRCPSGKSVTFGGYIAEAVSANPGPGIYALRIGADNSQVWSVTGRNIGSRRGKLTALAYCR